MLTIALGVGAALFLGAGFVLQQHVAAQAPWSDVLSTRLLVDLIRQPLWLLGIAVMVVGQLLGAAALGRGSLALVEPLLAANLLFALPLAAVWRRQRLGRREWSGAIALIGGLAGFLLAANPGHSPVAHVPGQSWLIAGGSVLAVACVLVWWARRTDQTAEGTLLGTGAGVLIGLQDALTNRAVPLLGHGLNAVVTSWEPYAVVAVALVSLVLGQSAFRAAPLTASLPGLTVAEPLTGIGLGAGLFAEPLRVTVSALGGEAGSLVAIVVGLLLLARSPVICAVPDREPVRPAGRTGGSAAS